MRTSFLLFLFTFLGYSQIPNYYSSIDFEQSSENVKDQLSLLITETHSTQLVYTSGSSGLLDVWTVLKQSDLDPQNPQNVLLFYGFNDQSSTVSEHRSRNKNSSCHISSCTGLWVREHVYPNSLGTPNLGTEFAGADAHNLRAIDSQRNNTRSNRKFGDSSSSTASYSINSNTWYPGDEWRGDVARIIMYMYLRYPTQCSANNLSHEASTFADGQDMPDLFLRWNQLDPPSEFEIQRNNVIGSLQGNRNPFIDNPYLATLLWNGPAAIDTWGTLSNNKFTQTNSIKIHPTITNYQINISTTLSIDKIEIYNQFAQKVLIPNPNNTIDLSSLASGMYFVKINSGSYQTTHKVIKQ